MLFRCPDCGKVIDAASSPILEGGQVAIPCEFHCPHCDELLTVCLGIRILSKKTGRLEPY